MSFLKKLFGGGSGSGSNPEADPIDYEGFRIYSEPMAEDGQFRLAARIEMGEGDSLKSHHLIRADLIRDRAQAEEAAVAKAKQMIDQLGERLFG